MRNLKHWGKQDENGTKKDQTRNETILSQNEREIQGSKLDPNFPVIRAKNGKRAKSKE